LWSPKFRYFVRISWTLIRILHKVCTFCEGFHIILHNLCQVLMKCSIAHNFLTRYPALYVGFNPGVKLRSLQGWCPCRQHEGENT
jgi:hypothetical protein